MAGLSRAAARQLARALGRAAKKQVNVPRPTRAAAETSRRPSIPIGSGLPDRVEEQISRELATAKVAKGSRAEKITVGGRSVTNFIKDQMSTSPGMAKRTQQDKAFYRAIREAKTQKEKDQLRKAHEKIRDRRAAFDKKQLESTRVKISQSSRGRKKAEPDLFLKALKAANQDGEIIPEFDQLLPREQMLIEQSANLRRRTGDPVKNTRRVLKGKMQNMQGGKRRKR